MKYPLYVVFGSDGQLGREFCAYFKNEHLSFEGFDYPDCDITKPESVLKAIDSRIGRRPFDRITIINCAAYTDVDGAEKQKDKSYEVNVLGSRNCAIVARQFEADFVHFSTDYIFNGRKNQPYTEDDSADPLNVYGHTKLQGENIVFNNCPKAYIVRLSWLFGRYGRNFVRKILELAKDGRDLKVVNDQTGSPTCAADVVPQVMRLLETGKYGIYHSASHGQTTWFGFAEKILALSGLKNRINPCSSSEYVSAAVRPANSILQNKKLAELGIDIMPSWEDALKRCLEKGFAPLMPLKK
jgi:dTDP-4-dehydrorhamnose reductase